MSYLLKFIVASSLLSPAFSQATAPEWGICGGRNWTGPTKCPVGWTCTVDNEFYSHCYKSAVVKTTPTPKSTTKSATTSTKKVSSVTTVKTTKLVSITTKPSTTTKGSSTPVITTSSTPSGPIATPWAQCGGISFTGPTICPFPFICVKINDNYSQCLPDPSVSTTKSSTPVITASPTPSGPVAPEWGQCGGQGFTGPTRCSFAFMCVKSNDFFSQCLPDPSVSTTKRTTSPGPSTTSRIPEPTLAYMFVFGDSYSRTGFDITGTKPSSANELGNPAPPGNTTSGGRNWVSYTTSSSEILAYNFASDGAVTDSALVTTSVAGALSFVDQVALFKANLSPAPAYAPWTSVDSLFVVWIGINDVASSFYLSDWATKSQQIVDRYFTQVQALYDAGARKFAFFTVPSIYKTPLMLAQPPAVQEQLETAVAHFNDLLKTGRNTFVAANSGLTNFYTQVMTTGLYFDILLENPTQHGAPDATCINSDGRSCLWWDNFHPGMSIQQNIQGMLSNIGGGIWACCGNTGL